MMLLVFALICMSVGALADHYLERKLVGLAEKMKKASGDVKSDLK